jgi:hypothetical protein
LGSPEMEDLRNHLITESGTQIQRPERTINKKLGINSHWNSSCKSSHPNFWKALLLFTNMTYLWNKTTLDNSKQSLLYFHDLKRHNKLDWMSSWASPKQWFKICNIANTVIKVLWNNIVIEVHIVIMKPFFKKDQIY